MRRVIIDPGHGGDDPGALALDGTREADLALRYAQTLGIELGARGAIISFTRVGDSYPTLAERARLANANDANLFVSVHFNASSNPHASGPWTLYAQPSVRGREVAQVVQRAMARVRGGDPQAVYPDGAGWTGGRTLYVLRATRMPAILLEVGFLTNREDLDELQSARVETQVCEAVADAIAEVMGLPGKPDPFAGVQWPTPELAIPKPAPPRADPSRLLLEPIEIPDRVPENVSGTWGIYTWAREVAENAAAEAADRSRQIHGADRLVDHALWRLQKVAAKRLHPVLLAILWPFVERAADRVFEGR